jgi:acyl-CoA hydrolase
MTRLVMRVASATAPDMGSYPYRYEQKGPQMPTRVAINGFGRVGRSVLRIAHEQGADLEIVISDGVMTLDRDGALDPTRPIVCSFLFGSPELYRWVDENPRLRMTRTETTNDPSRIAARTGMVSVNTALQVDLSDQAGASHIGGRLYSGFGGQPDFVEGALHSPGGHAVIALRSWHQPSDTSTIVPRLTDPVTSFQHSAVVTEQGCAHIFGRSQRAQARLIIDHAAHPDARDQLREHAARLGVGARSTTAQRSVASSRT